MPAEAKDLEASLARVVEELDHLKAGLRLLGVKQCSYCRKYFLSQDGKTLIEAGELVCYKCLQKWWQERSPSFTIEERQAAEHKLLRWLVAHHGAKVIRQAGKLPRPADMELKIVVTCEECNGSGKNESRAECHNCEGRGSVWVVKLWPGLG